MHRNMETLGIKKARKYRERTIKRTLAPRKAYDPLQTPGHQGNKYRPKCANPGSQKL